MIRRVWQKIISRQDYLDRWIYPALLIVLAFLCFGHALDNHFLSDDVGNLCLAKDNSLLNLFKFSGPWGRYEYTPVMFFFFKPCYFLFGNNFAGHFFASLLVHAFTGVLVYFLAKLFIKNSGICFLTAALFTVFRYNYGTVYYTTFVVTPLVTFFSLASLLLFTKYLKDNRLVYYAASVIFFALAMFTKQNAAGLIFVIVLLGFYLQKSDKPIVIFKRYIPFALILIVYAAIYIYRSHHYSDGPLGRTPSLGFYIFSHLGIITYRFIHLVFFLNFDQIDKSFHWHSQLNPSFWTNSPLFVLGSYIFLFIFLLVIWKWRNLRYAFLAFLFFALPCAICRDRIQGDPRHFYYPTVFAVISFGIVFEKLFIFLREPRGVVLRVLAIFLFLALIASHFRVSHFFERIYAAHGRLYQFALADLSPQLSRIPEDSKILLRVPSEWEGDAVMMNYIRLHWPEKNFDVHQITLDEDPDLEFFNPEYIFDITFSHYYPKLYDDLFNKDNIGYLIRAL